eukprot:SAG25_NODE_647_length_6214_cov_5.107277_7_plen_63_part_00
MLSQVGTDWACMWLLRVRACVQLARVLPRDDEIVPTSAEQSSQETEEEEEEDEEEEKAEESE